MARPGQAMLEALLAVCLVTSAFLALFKLSQMLTGKILLQHAAMRTARARAVGFNDFMCRKSARVAVIPVAGRRLWPVGDDEFGWAEEDARVRDYLCAPDGARARAILEYEKWGALGVKPGDGTKATTSMKTDWFDLVGEAGIEPHATLYMRNLGL